MRTFTAGRESVEVRGATLREVIEALESQYPGIQARLCDGENVRPGLSVVIDGQVSREGLEAIVSDKAEVHFIPAIGGGSSSVARDTDGRR